MNGTTMILRSNEELLAELKLAEQRLTVTKLQLEAELVDLQANRRRFWPRFWWGFLGSALINVGIILVALRVMK